MSANRRLPLSVRVLAPAAVLVAVAVTACDPDEVGAAAVVGDERYTISQLQDDAEKSADLRESQGNPDSVTLAQEQVTQINYRVRTIVNDEIAKREDVEITEAEIDTFIEKEIASAAPEGDVDAFLAANGFTSGGVREFVRTALIETKIAEELGEQAANEMFVATADDLGVEINPRYGEWAESQVDPVSGSVSEPAGAEAGAAGLSP